MFGVNGLQHWCEDTHPAFPPTVHPFIPYRFQYSYLSAGTLNTDDQITPFECLRQSVEHLTAYAAERFQGSAAFQQAITGYLDGGPLG